MNAPQIIVIAIWSLYLLLHAAKHGEPKPAEKYNLPAAVISRAIWVALLWWGGFFPGGAA